MAPHLGASLSKAVLAPCQAVLQGSDVAVLVSSCHAQALQLASHLRSLLPEGCLNDVLCHMQLPIRMRWKQIGYLQCTHVL